MSYNSEILKEEKTVREWLEELPSHIKEQILNNNKVNKWSNDAVISFKNIIIYSHNWANSKEGYNYWSQLSTIIYYNPSTFEKYLPDFYKKYPQWSPKQVSEINNYKIF